MVRANLFLGGTKHYLGTRTFWWLKKSIVYAKAALEYWATIVYSNQNDAKYLDNQIMEVEEKLVLLHVRLIFYYKRNSFRELMLNVLNFHRRQELVDTFISLQKT